MLDLQWFVVICGDLRFSGRPSMNERCLIQDGSTHHENFIFGKNWLLYILRANENQHTGLYCTIMFINPSKLTFKLIIYYLLHQTIDNFDLSIYDIRWRDVIIRGVRMNHLTHVGRGSEVFVRLASRWNSLMIMMVMMLALLTANAYAANWCCIIGLRLSLRWSCSTQFVKRCTQHSQDIAPVPSHLQCYCGLRHVWSALHTVLSSFTQACPSRTFKVEQRRLVIYAATCCNLKRDKAAVMDKSNKTSRKIRKCC